MRNTCSNAPSNAWCCFLVCHALKEGCSRLCNTPVNAPAKSALAAASLAASGFPSVSRCSKLIIDTTVWVTVSSTTSNNPLSRNATTLRFSKNHSLSPGVFFKCVSKCSASHPPTALAAATLVATGSRGDVTHVSHFNSPIGQGATSVCDETPPTPTPAPVFPPFALGGGFVFGKWKGTGLLFFFLARRLIFRPISGFPDPVVVANAAWYAKSASASSPFSSSANAFRKCDFSQSGRSNTQVSASASDWVTLFSFRKDALRLLKTDANSGFAVSSGPAALMALVYAPAALR
mmetsp:Transcript_4610/g.15340  ORF Transcript_4610/g.15340 Transcript_4610/m.15340 type:complete len:291 (+) Transcript_4610:592-1464(+)